MHLLRAGADKNRREGRLADAILLGDMETPEEKWETGCCQAIWELKMDKLVKLVKGSLLLTVLLCFAALDDFLSLHDIFRDYVSQAALHGMGIQTSKELPDWTATPLEWTSVTISYIFRVVVLGLNLLVLMKLRSRLRILAQP